LLIEHSSIMKITIISISTALVAVIVVLSVLGNGSSNPSLSSSASPLLEERIVSLEKKLNEEIQARKSLETLLNNEREKRLALANRISEIGNLETALNDRLNNIGNNRANDLNRNRFSTPTPNTEEQRVLLIQAGFNDFETDTISSGERVNARQLALQTQTDIRSELGDGQYELYLETTGRPTTIPVSRIAEGSAGQVAGLQEGDEIISYDGERVFNILDLQRLTEEGTEGQTVIIDVMRDDSPVTLAIPRGQIGISSRGTGRRGFIN